MTEKPKARELIYTSLVDERGIEHVRWSDWFLSLSPDKRAKAMADIDGGALSRRRDGVWEPTIPVPYPHSLFPWLWKRITGWRDAYGRRAQFIGWKG